MEFHPQKCQVLHITSKRKSVLASYTIHGHTLEEVSSAKYLGVTLQNNLSWNFHVDTIAKKAKNTRAFLQRSLQQCPKKTKELCYTTLVHPIMEYASVVWDPFTEENIRKLEMVQRRALVYADYRLPSSVTLMLQQLQWSTLQERRAQAKVIIVYQIVYSLVDTPADQLITTTAYINERSQHEVHGSLCKDTRLPTILLPRHRQTLEQPSPVSSQLSYP